MYPSLAIECTDKISSIAISKGEEVWQVEQGSEQRQAKNILSLVDQCLAKAKLDKTLLRSICWASGPGSFTGLRIGTAVSQGLAYALNLPLVAVSSLEAMATSVMADMEGEGTILTISDAHMGEYYWATFGYSGKNRSLVRTSDDSLTKLEEVLLSKNTVLAVGNAANRLQTANIVKKINHSPMRAKHLFGLAEISFDAGDQISAMQAEPAYLRSKSAWKTLEQQRGQS
ncbi:MAG: tRNA (adenosine(37)-N6)-threonylcarbamoyltransferase complex dimerization subunit type 1 TsaB [Porticoccaceae bacterium]|jgi:tRNA threonylcarbamoyladenosine biosynthesis protein TsaB|nr:tRNA (adenosine(37)-N6)-threonylcarbamoyltransferase complex dimerization subunit type 1 TsaB [Porticoccaceae bacterium]